MVGKRLCDYLFSGARKRKLHLSSQVRNQLRYLAAGRAPECQLNGPATHFTDEETGCRDETLPKDIQITYTKWPVDIEIRVNGAETASRPLKSSFHTVGRGCPGQDAGACPSASMCNHVWQSEPQQEKDGTLIPNNRVELIMGCTQAMGKATNDGAVS